MSGAKNGLMSETFVFGGDVACESPKVAEIGKTLELDADVCSDESSMSASDIYVVAENYSCSPDVDVYYVSVCCVVVESVASSKNDGDSSLSVVGVSAVATGDPVEMLCH